MRFFLLLLFLLPFTLCAEESELPAADLSFETSELFNTPESWEPPLFDTTHLIGGVISPLSGNPYFRVTDFVAVGAQEIPLQRIYNPPLASYATEKQWKKESVYRRMALANGGEAWKIFPHLALKVISSLGILQLTTPQGATYEFDISKPEIKLRKSEGITNLGEHETPGGKYDPRNIRIIHGITFFKVYDPEGAERLYEFWGGLYLLTKERLPNGKVLRYKYNNKGVLERVESLDPQERYLYASISADLHPKEGYSHYLSSTGLEAHFTFENRLFKEKLHGEMLWCQGRMPPALIEARTPQFQEERLHYTDPYSQLDHYCGKDLTFTLNHAGIGEHSHLRVDKLSLPVGPNDTSLPVYEISYQPVTGEREGHTRVKCSNGTSLCYLFSKDSLLTALHYFDAEGDLKKEKRYSWNGKNQLASLEVRGEEQVLLLRKSYEYDSFGNPLTETLTGDLRGEGQEESYTISRTFSQEGRNLLLREENEEGKITLYNYLPNTNLITLKQIREGEKILLQETFLYDDCHNLIQKTLGDGQSQSRITRYQLRQESPFLHLPAVIVESYLSEGRELPLQKSLLTYDSYGNVSEERVYDAEVHYAYTLFKEYSAGGNLLSETDALGHKQTYTYDAKGRCIGKQCTQNLREESSYDTLGRLLEHREIGREGQRSVAYLYDHYNNILEKRDEFGNLFSYSYDPLTLRVSRTEYPSIESRQGSSAVVTSAEYDVYGRESAKRDAQGHCTHYRYNAYGLLTEVTHPQGGKETYRYTRGGNLASYCDSDGLETRYTLDLLDRVIAKEVGGALVERAIYDSFNLLEEKDAEGYSTRYFYDGAGRKIREEQGDRITEFGYDTLGRLNLIRKEGLTTLFTRDFKGNLLEEISQDSRGTLLSKIRYTYTPTGEVEKIIRDIQGQEAVTSFTYDSFGREIAEQDPLGHKTVTSYNDQCLNALGQRVLQITQRDPLGTTRVETYNALSHIAKEEKFSAQGLPLSGWEKFYDGAGNVVDWCEKVYSEGHSRSSQWTHFTYSPSGQVTSSTRAFSTPEARTLNYTYTPGGKLCSKREPSGTLINYSYDLLGRLERIDATPEPLHHRFKCNKRGELVEIVDEVENLVIRRELDRFGNVLKESFPGGLEIKKAYDAFDRLTLLDVGKQGYITYLYDPLHLKRVQRFSASGELAYSHHYESYDLSGHLLSEQMPLKTGSIKHAYDLKGRQQELASPFFHEEARYDACDQLLEKKTDLISSSFTYDELSQLTSENGTKYSYDSLFNRLGKNEERFSVNSLNESSHSLYDLNGNCMQQGESHYTYDPLHRLTEARLGDTLVHFTYDPLGRRLSKKVSQRKNETWQELYKENYLYEGEEEIGALTPEGHLKNFRVLSHLPHRRSPHTVAIELEQSLFVPLTDLQGNICRLVDPLSKKLAASYAFTAFGEELKRVHDNNPWRYASKRIDNELKLINFGKRIYNPQQATWLSMDPYGFIDSLNLYQYAFNNPFSYYDPQGEFIFLVAIPVALIFNPIVLKLCVDAVIVGMSCWAVHQTMNYAAEACSSPYTLTEGLCQILTRKAFHKFASPKMDVTKYYEKNCPGTEEDLQKNPDWNDISHPDQLKNGHRLFENTKTGEKIRFDKGDPSLTGHEALDHYHRFNPAAPKGKAGKKVLYLDNQGNPVAKGSDRSHLYPPETIN